MTLVGPHDFVTGAPQDLNHNFRVSIGLPPRCVLTLDFDGSGPAMPGGVQSALANDLRVWQLHAMQ